MCGVWVVVLVMMVSLLVMVGMLEVCCVVQFEVGNVVCCVQVVCKLVLVELIVVELVCCNMLCVCIVDNFGMDCGVVMVFDCIVCVY